MTKVQTYFDTTDPPWDEKRLMRFTKSELIELVGMQRERVGEHIGTIPHNSLRVLWYFGEGNEDIGLLKKMFKKEIIRVLNYYVEL